MDDHCPGGCDVCTLRSHASPAISEADPMLVSSGVKVTTPFSPKHSTHLADWRFPSNQAHLCSMSSSGISKPGGKENEEWITLCNLSNTKPCPWAPDIWAGSQQVQKTALCDGGTGGGHLELSCALGGHMPVPILARVTSPHSHLSCLRL